MFIVGFATIVYTIFCVIVIFSNVPGSSVCLVLRQLGAAHVVLLGRFLDVACARILA